MQIFWHVTLDDNETASCPDKKCTYNRRDRGLKRGLTCSCEQNEDGTLGQIYCVYCPYCRSHLKIVAHKL